MRFDAALGAHEGRVGQDHIGQLVPLVVLREGVVLHHMRVGKAVQVQVGQAQAHHVGRDVVTLDVGGQACALVGREEVAGCFGLR